MEFKEFLKSAASVVPSKRQLDWFDTEFYAFVHFTVNTYTNLEWGLGNEDEKIFNPYDLNCDEWVEAIKSAGMKGLVLTAKHHDGFCLWPSKYTEHCVKNSPWKDGKGDVVRECADACRRGGIKFGVYLSPWDRNCKLYGTEAYNDYYCNQLEELLTGYGELFMVWFDGACGEGPNGRRQVYDYDRYISLIRKYQPNASIFNDFGPDVRWCGNEAGQARRSEWAVVPTDLCFRCEPQTGKGPLNGDLTYMYNHDQNIGELNNIMYAKSLGFAGAEIDMSIRYGWFYHENEEPHSLDRLFNTYLNSCGANTSFNLNIPPMPSGRFDPRDIARLKELGEALENAFGEKKKLPCEIRQIEMDSDTQCKFEITLDGYHDIGFMNIMEDLTKGQRIETFRIINGEGVRVYEGYTVGHRKICQLSNVRTDKLTLFVTGARDTVHLRDISVFEK
ncbi:MAG: alpha-L-fucosidase [Firmicutes bacterium]|nr:alpha-L-fucosidase [Bacillota bacterium]